MPTTGPGLRLMLAVLVALCGLACGTDTTSDANPDAGPGDDVNDGGDGDGDSAGDGDGDGDGDAAPDCDTTPCEGQSIMGFPLSPCCIDADTCGIDATAINMGCIDPTAFGGGTGVMMQGNMTTCAGVTCEEACAGGGCDFQCDQAGDCTFDCADGGCMTACDEEANCHTDCAGGGCVVDCDEPNTVCSVTCGGDTPCEIMCTDGATATCEGNCNVAACP